MSSTVKWSNFRLPHNFGQAVVLDKLNKKYEPYTYTFLLTLMNKVSSLETMCSSQKQEFKINCWQVLNIINTG